MPNSHYPCLSFEHSMGPVPQKFRVNTQQIPQLRGETQQMHVVPTATVDNQSKPVQEVTVILPTPTHQHTNTQHHLRSKALLSPGNWLVPNINLCNVIQTYNGATDWLERLTNQVQRHIATLSTFLGGEEPISLYQGPLVLLKYTDCEVPWQRTVVPSLVTPSLLNCSVTFKETQDSHRCRSGCFLGPCQYLTYRTCFMHYHFIDTRLYELCIWCGEVSEGYGVLIMSLFAPCSTEKKN